MKSGLARFWYRFKNWFRTKPGPGEPLRFLCGSEEELRRVTTWICHANPEIFQNPSIPVVAYRSAYEDKVGYAELITPSPMPSFIDTPTLLRTFDYDAINALCSLAFQHNQFEGTEWIDTSPMIFLPGTLGYRFGLPMLAGITEHGSLMFIRVHSPSAHERAEALLALSEWLNGKVSEQEKRELLQLTDDMEV